ncbi:MAG: hypothetical protein SPF22_08080 [Candidatus Onthovivens sp.]|nr:hypothetical protein [Candidatus Onthovivens sp.]
MEGARLSKEEYIKNFLTQVDIFMELFPSMSYQDTMNMPYKQFRYLIDIRRNRKIKEQKDIEDQRKKTEEANKKEMAKNKIYRSGR